MAIAIQSAFQKFNHLEMDRRYLEAMKLMRYFIFSVLICASSCESLREGTFSQMYRNNTTGGYVIFENSGKFYYAFTPRQSGSDRDNRRSTNQGSYSFDEGGKLKIVTRSAHVGLFTLEFSDSKNILYVLRKSEAGEELDEIYTKTRGIVDR